MGKKFNSRKILPGEIVDESLKFGKMSGFPVAKFGALGHFGPASVMPFLIS